jgi:hypothetical protein
MPLADYMHLCRQHIAKTWPPEIPEPITKEINLLHELSEAMNPPKGPKNEKEFAKLITQPLTYRRRDPLIHIQSEPELNPMSQEKADKFYSTSPSKIDRIALVAMTETAFTPQAFAALQEADIPIKNKCDQLSLLKFEQTDERGFFLCNGIVMHEYQDKNAISHPAVVVL